MMGSEFYWHKFSSPEKNNPLFSGGEIMLTYLFTGESSAYNTNTAIFGLVPINKSVFKGGPGTFEEVLRFSAFDPDGVNIKGGKFWRITPPWLTGICQKLCGWNWDMVMVYWIE
jgi:phosphate-selective porin OprO/OprP